MRHFYGLSIEEAYKYSHVDGLSVYFPALALILEIFALEIKSIRRIRLNRHSLLITFFSRIWILFICYSGYEPEAGKGSGSRPSDL